MDRSKLAALLAVFGSLAGLIGLVVLADQLTFDRELSAQEARLVQQSEKSDRELLEQVMKGQQLLVAQLRVQYLTLRQDLLIEQIERLETTLMSANDSELDWLEDRLRALRDKLSDVERQLEAHLLGRLP